MKAIQKRIEKYIQEQLRLHPEWQYAYNIGHSAGAGNAINIPGVLNIYFNAYPPRTGPNTINFSTFGDIVTKKFARTGMTIPFGKGGHEAWDCYLAAKKKEWTDFPEYIVFLQDSEGTVYIAETQEEPAELAEQVGIFDSVGSAAASAGIESFVSSFTMRSIFVKSGLAPAISMRKITYESVKDGCEAAAVAGVGQMAANFLKKNALQGSSYALGAVTQTYSIGKSLYVAWNASYEDSKLCKATVAKIANDKEFIRKIEESPSKKPIIISEYLDNEKNKKCPSLSNCVIL